MRRNVEDGMTDSYVVDSRHMSDRGNQLGSSYMDGETGILVALGSKLVVRAVYRSHTGVDLDY